MIKTIIDNQITQDDIKKYDFIHHAITKDEVENMNFIRIKETLRTFEEAGKQGKNKLMITFSGYLDSSKEVYEINDVRKYVANLLNEFPHIFYFLTDADFTSTIFLLCLCDIKDGEKINGFFYVTNSEIELSIKGKIIEGIINYGAQIGENEEDLLEIIINIFKSKNITPYNLLKALERDLSYLKTL